MRKWFIWDDDTGGCLGVLYAKDAYNACLQANAKWPNVQTFKLTYAT